MNKTYKVSVIISSFNLGEFIEAAVESVLKQNYSEPVEVIIVEDGSTDRATIEKVRELENKLEVRVIWQENKGLPGARNTGVAAANGKYIACLDSDDLFHEDFIGECVRVLDEDREEEIGFVTTYVQTFGEMTGIWETPDWSEKARLELLIRNCTHASSMFRKSAWAKTGGYNTNMKEGYEDWDFWIGLVEAGYRWKRIPRPLFLYRKRKNSMLTATVSRHNELFKRIVENHPEIYSRFHREIIVELARLFHECEETVRIYDSSLSGRLHLLMDFLRKGMKEPSFFFKYQNYYALFRKLRGNK